MIVLAIDTAQAACQAVLVRDGEALAMRSEAMERGHQERLAPMVAELFAEAGLTPSAVDRVAVTLGPGSFTGLRVGIAFAKGMALALRRPLIGIGALEALAAGSIGRVAAVIAAPHGRVYLQAFQDGRPLVLPALTDIEAGEAACARYAIERLLGPGAANLAFAAERDRRPAPDPVALADLAASAPTPTTRPQPLYLREPDAKTIAEREASKAAAAPVTPPEPILRSPVAADFPALAALHAKSFDHPWSTADLADFASRPGACTLLVEENGLRAGFILCWSVAGEAEVLTLAVHPAARGRGFGTALVKAAIGLCSRNGAGTMWLEVADDNAPALALYAACGFEPAGRRNGYYDRGPLRPRVDAILLRSALNSGG